MSESKRLEMKLEPCSKVLVCTLKLLRACRRAGLQEGRLRWRQGMVVGQTAEAVPKALIQKGHEERGIDVVAVGST